MTRFSIAHKRITLSALVVLLFAGVNAYLTLPQAEDPGFIIRTAVVQTIFPGANPERVANLVTDPLEVRLQEMPEVKNIRSQSKTGVSVVWVDIRDEYSDMRPIWDKLRRKVDDARSTLPSNVIGPEVNDEFGDVFGTIIALTGEGYNYEELRGIAKSVRDQLLRLPDTGKVELLGIQAERVYFEFSNARLAELGLTVMQLAQALQARNIIIPGGSVVTDGERLQLEPSGNYETVDELRKTVISVPGRQDLLYLEDIGEIVRSFEDPPQSMIRSSGKPALLIAISLKETGNVISLGDDVTALVAQLNEQYPIGVDFEIVRFQASDVARKVDDFANNVLQAIGIVLAVMLLMLGLRTGLVVASLIPSAMLVTMFLMTFLDLTLNQMTLASLIIALGMLVDNAIVMSESVLVKMQDGIDRVTAAIDSASELRIPLLTSSLTTAAAFLPIYLAEGSMGEYTGVLFTIVTVTLLGSWVLSLTVIPLLCVLFLKVSLRSGGEAFSSRFYRAYRSLLLVGLRFPAVLLVSVVGLFWVTMQAAAYLPNIFFPPSDVPMFTAEFRAPIGTDIDETDAFTRRLDEFVEAEMRVNGERAQGVTNWTTFVGQAPPRFALAFGPSPASYEYSFLLFNVNDRATADVMVAKLEDFVNREFPSIVPKVQPLQLGSPIEHPVEVRVSGPDRQRLFEIVDDVKAKLASYPATKNIDDDWGAQSKKITVDISGPRSRRSGITNQDIAISLQSVLTGYDATDFRENDRLIPVTLRSAAGGRTDVGKLETLNVYSQQTGNSVPLKQVAELRVDWQPAKILRRDHLENVTVSADLNAGTTPTEITNDLIPWIEEQAATEWPVGFFWSLGGEFESSQDSSEAINAKLPIAGLAIVFLLIAQFDSLRRPAIILLTIPLGVIGVIWGLLVTGSYFGFMTLLGVISLAGIVINNAIVLIDRIDIEIREGREPAQAILHAAQQRLRPILLTTLTTLGSLIPMWLGGGPMWEPMAIAIIFGLAFATLLTLGVVPVLYRLFFRVSYRGFRYQA